MLADSIRELGVDARVGGVPGEYCPGAWSVNARGATKLVGTGQRLIAGAAHRGAVIVVGNSAGVRDALIGVYEALGLDWDPATAGSIEDEVAGITLERVEASIFARLGGLYELRETPVDRETLALADRLECDHSVE